jgi:hypothetical protein
VSAIACPAIKERATATYTARIETDSKWLSRKTMLRSRVDRTLGKSIAAAGRQRVSHVAARYPAFSKAVQMSLVAAFNCSFLASDKPHQELHR